MTCLVTVFYRIMLRRRAVCNNDSTGGSKMIIEFIIIGRYLPDKNTEEVHNISKLTVNLQA